MELFQDGFLEGNVPVYGSIRISLPSQSLAINRWSVMRKAALLCFGCSGHCLKKLILFLLQNC